MFKKAKPLKKPEDEEHAYNYALFLLNLRLRTEGEMREKMLARGYIPKVIDSVMERLKGDKYVNDENYADIFLNNMILYKQYGYFHMKKKLILKKLPNELIENKLEELVDEKTEKEIAKRYLATVVTRNAKDLEKEIAKLDYVGKQKLKQKLLMRGFRSSVVMKVIK